jgi:type II secretory pathway predicted ATPase ExeA
MYYHHFGLSGPPFQFTPRADSLYLSSEHSEALAFLEWSVRNEPTGFAALAGESGVGKTTLICSVIARFSGSVDVALVANPRLNTEQMLITVLSQLGVAAGGLNKFDAIERLLQLLDDRAAELGPAIILDEAQELSEEMFSELRLLSNQGIAAGHCLRIILVGQPELLERLRSPQLHAFNQRVGARTILHPMKTSDAYDYVKSQVQAKGAQVAKVFLPAALRLLIEHSHGNPRRINVLCHNAMLTAYGSHRNRVDIASARSAVAEYDNLSIKPQNIHRNSRKDSPSRWTRALLLLTVSVAVIVTLAFVLLRHPSWLVELFGRNAQTAVADKIHNRAAANGLMFKSVIPGVPIATHVAVNRDARVVFQSLRVQQTNTKGADTAGGQHGLSLYYNGGKKALRPADRPTGSSCVLKQTANISTTLGPDAQNYPIAAAGLCVVALSKEAIG